MRRTTGCVIKWSGRDRSTIGLSTFWSCVVRSLSTDEELSSLFDQLFPICRSITGDGVRQTIKILQEYIPLVSESVPTGQKVFDWTVPPEWNVSEAYLDDDSGQRIVDFKNNNLHIVNYSEPIEKTLSLEELQPHLHSLPHLPDAIPYVTSYYKKNWGFCLSHKQREKLKNTKYRAVIRSELKSGELIYAHHTLPATVNSQREVLLSTYICHPSMANNELSGPLVTTMLYQKLKKMPVRQFNYRFVFVPETIGSICYLAKYGNYLKENLYAGLVVTCCGDQRAVNYKKTRDGNHEIDHIAQHILKHSQLANIRIRDFFPMGSDERQYCSPGFNLPVGSLTRSMYGEYEEYHTSLDNKQFISMAGMLESTDCYYNILRALEMNCKYLNTNPNCEPMLSKRGLYPTIGASKSVANLQKQIAYLLCYSDGRHDLLTIAEKAGVSILDLEDAVSQLREVKLLEPLKDEL